MLMDIFYNSCSIKKKRRVHFHKFMLEIHKRIHDFKQDLLRRHGRDVHLNLSSERDAIVQVARKISEEAKLLCFDEFQVTDICDAMILKKFMSELWDCGTVLIATSNRPPSDLYKDGINRMYFMPFIRRLEEECVVCDIQSLKDYRLDAKMNPTPAFYTPLSSESTAQLLEQYLLDGGQYPMQAFSIPVMMGRKFLVDGGSLKKRVCWIEFKRLCEDDVGAADYQVRSNFNP